MKSPPEPPSAEVDHEVCRNASLMLSRPASIPSFLHEAHVLELALRIMPCNGAWAVRLVSPWPAPVPSTPPRIGCCCTAGAHSEERAAAAAKTQAQRNATRFFRGAAGTYGEADDIPDLLSPRPALAT